MVKGALTCAEEYQNTESQNRLAFEGQRRTCDGILLNTKLKTQTDMSLLSRPFLFFMDRFLKANAGCQVILGNAARPDAGLSFRPCSFRIHQIHP